MWPFKKKPTPWTAPFETTFSESVIIAGKARSVICGIKQTGENSGLYTTWMDLNSSRMPKAKLHPGGIDMPRTQATKAAEALGRGFVDHLKVQKLHLESQADD